MNLKNSELHQFYKKSHEQRLKAIQDFANLSSSDISILKKSSPLDFNAANRMIENVISVHCLPLGIATNFKINNKDFLIPMVTEEASVIAAASNGAKLARKLGGFTAQSSHPKMIGQIQLVDVKDTKLAVKKILSNKKSLLNLANKQDPILVNLGGGAQDLKPRVLNTIRGDMVVIHLIVNVQDAMGANIIDTMLEAISPKIESLTNGKTRLKIVSNLAVYRITEATAKWSAKSIGKECIEGILDAYALAKADPFRAATHNKGIMNGIDAVALATGNDFRAIEASAHAFASLKAYQPLTKYYKDENGDLVGKIKIPLCVGTTGGCIKSHPTAKIALKILGITKSTKLAKIMACVGLAQNFAALKALVTTGIQKGHMKLHSKNIAIAAGAKNHLIDKISQTMVVENNISIIRAKELLSQERKK